VRARLPLELVHFGCTSEDINNLSYALMLKSARTTLVETLQTRIDELAELAHRYAVSGDARAYSRSTRKSHDSRQGVCQRHGAAAPVPCNVGRRLRFSEK